MARETKIGVALMVLLVGVFAAVVYKKWDGLKATVASNGAETPKGGAETPAVAKPKKSSAEPAANPFTNAQPIAAAPTPAEEASNPFAGAGGGARVPTRQVSATADEGWNEPVVQAEPVPQSEPAEQVESAAAAEPFERDGQPVEEPAAVAADTSSDSPAASESAADDPFGSVAETSPSDPGEPVAESAAPEPAAEEPASVAATSPTANSTVTTAEPAATSETVDPFGDATAEPAAITDAAEPATDDPFAEASGADVAETAEIAEEAAEEAHGSADPFDPAAGAAGAVSGSERTEIAEQSVDDAFAEPTAPADSANAELAGIEPEPSADAFAEADAEPTSTAAVEGGATGRSDYYVVTENDSYWTISRRVYGTAAYFHALTKYNEARIPDPKRLRPGMTILTPPAEELRARFPKLVARNAGEAEEEKPAKAGFLVDAAGRPTYRVGEADTLGKIAQSHLGRASRWVQIYEMNRQAIPDAKTLKPGTVLRLPADASRVRLVPEG